MRNFLFLDQAAEGAGTGTAGGSLLSTVGLIAVMGFMIYFLLYRPQKKQEKAVTEMRNSLAVGDEITTTGGILGKVVQIKEDFIVIETGTDRTKLKMTKGAIRSIEHRADEDDEEE